MSLSWTIICRERETFFLRLKPHRSDMWNEVRIGTENFTLNLLRDRDNDYELYPPQDDDDDLMASMSGNSIYAVQPPPQKWRNTNIDIIGEENCKAFMQEVDRLNSYSSGHASGNGPQPPALLKKIPPRDTPGKAAPTVTTPNNPYANSCVKCPSFLSGTNDASRQRGIFGIETGIDMCGKKGIPLASRQMTSVNKVQYRKAIYAVCAAKDDPWDGKISDDPADYEPSDSSDYKFRLFDEMTGVVPNELDINDPDSMLEKADSCAGCVNYFRPEDMFESLGIPLAGCGATGTIIPAGHANIRCVGCDYNIAGTPNARERLNDITHDMAGFGVIFVGDESQSLVNPDSDGLAEDPETVATEKPVTDEDTEKGIRAWVKLRDDVFMPVFRRDFFSEDEQKKIPRAGDDEHPELYQDHLGLLEKFVIVWTKLNETPAVNGLAGSGKTEAFRYAAWRMQLPFERTSITASTELDDLAGRMLFEKDETTFHRGRIPTSWEKPCILLIDEPNTGSNAVWQFLRPLTDNSKQLVLDMNKGERVDRNEFCFMGMAFNPSWDHLNVGTHEISDADGRRLVHISVPNPEADLEKQIIARRCQADGYQITEGTLTNIMGISEDLRLQAKNQTIPIQWGTAQAIKTARLSRWFSLRDAVKMAIADLLEPEQRELVMQAVKGRVPDETTNSFMN